jgi:thymidylate synthase (FAD)
MAAAVSLITFMGDDLMVVNAARVSFAKEVSVMTPADEKLINYLAKHNHITPFFHPQIQFRIKMPIFVAREWYRHQIGFARNEVSRRYISTTPELWTPCVNDLREKHPSMKQGSKSTPISDDVDETAALIADHNSASVSLYETLLERKIAPEIARTILPQNMYTEFIETGSLAAYARLYKLRYSPDAQLEIQHYAELIGREMEKIFPVSWKALTLQV